jgi:hypothetical protein
MTVVVEEYTVLLTRNRSKARRWSDKAVAHAGRGAPRTFPGCSLKLLILEPSRGLKNPSRKICWRSHPC